MADSAEDDMDETEMMEETPEVQDEVEAVEEIVELD